MTHRSFLALGHVAITEGLDGYVRQQYSTVNRSMKSIENKHIIVFTAWHFNQSAIVRMWPGQYFPPANLEIYIYYTNTPTQIAGQPHQNYMEAAIGLLLNGSMSNQKNIAQRHKSS